MAVTLPITRNIQDRLGKYHDPLKRKLNDNLISLSSQASDAIRIRLNKNKMGDIASRIVEEVTVLPIIFPSFKDVPFRRIAKDLHAHMTIETLPAISELFPFELVSVRAIPLQLGDLIFKINIEPDLEFPLVIILEVTELLGTFGFKSMVSTKYKAVYYNDSLPEEIVQTVTSIALRRLSLTY